MCTTHAALGRYCLFFFSGNARIQYFKILLRAIHRNFTTTGNLLDPTTSTVSEKRSSMLVSTRTRTVGPEACVEQQPPSGMYPSIHGSTPPAGEWRQSDSRSSCTQTPRLASGDWNLATPAVLDQLYQNTVRPWVTFTSTDLSTKRGR